MRVEPREGQRSSEGAPSKNAFRVSCLRVLDITVGLGRMDFHFHRTLCRRPAFAGQDVPHHKALSGPMKLKTTEKNNVQCVPLFKKVQVGTKGSLRPKLRRLHGNVPPYHQKIKG